jgi:hypothetical protein
LKKVLLLFILTFTAFGASAQFKGFKPKKKEKELPEAINLAYIGISSNGYAGDLNVYDKWASALHMGFKLNHRTHLNGNVNFSIGNITGQDPYFVNGNPEFTGKDYSPSKYFNTSVITANYDLHLNIIKKQNLIVYLSQGIGIIRFNPKDEFGNPLQKQPQTRVPGEVYGNTAIMLPTNLGFIYFFPNRFGAGIQAGFLNTQTDYLDNISLLGPNDRNDNVLQVRFSFYAPLRLEKLKEFDRK